LRRKLIGRRHQMVWHDASQLDRAGQTLTPRLDPPVAVLAERILRLVQKRGLERAEHDPGRNRMDSVRARVKVSSVDCQRALEHLATLDGASVEPRRFALDEIVDVTIPNA
jgi:acetolactate synthase regulatory subunit